jgi:hypothetical protein
VTQRGNRRLDVFHSDADRQRYLALLAHYSLQHGLAIGAYCTPRRIYAGAST